MNQRPIALVIECNATELAQEIQTVMPEVQVIELSHIVSMHSAIHHHKKDIKLIVYSIRAEEFQNGHFCGRVVASAGKMTSWELEDCLFVYCIDSLVSVDKIQEEFGPITKHTPEESRSLIMRTDWDNQKENASEIAKAYRDMIAKVKT